MAKLKGKEKAAFLRRMAKGRAEAAKKRKSKSKSKKSKSRSTVRSRSGGTDRNRSNINDALLLAIKDPKVKEIVIKK